MFRVVHHDLFLVASARSTDIDATLAHAFLPLQPKIARFSDTSHLDGTLGFRSARDGHVFFDRGDARGRLGFSGEGQRRVAVELQLTEATSRFIREA